MICTKLLKFNVSYGWYITGRPYRACYCWGLFSLQTECSYGAIGNYLFRKYKLKSISTKTP